MVPLLLSVFVVFDCDVRDPQIPKVQNRHKE